MRDMDAIKARLEAATPGPWGWDTPYTKESERYWWLHPLPAVDYGDIIFYAEKMARPCKDDADFIANTPTDIHHLIERVEKLEAGLECMLNEHDLDIREIKYIARIALAEEESQ